MEIISGILLGFGLILLVLLARPITTTVHELGHALPALLFTDKRVTIYVGSYGNIDNSWKVQLGRLRYIFKLRLLDWNLGLCQHAGANWRQLVIIVLGGPIFSLLFGLLMIWLFTLISSESLRFVVALFAVSTILDFLVNVIPSPKPLRTHDGGAINNDGSQFLYLLKTKNYPDEYIGAQLLIQEGRVDEGILLLEQLEKSRFQPKELYLNLAEAYMAQKNYDAAIASIMDMRDKYKLAPTDYETLGRSYYEMGKKTEAIQLYSKAIEMEFYNAQAFNSRGVIYNDLGYYEKAKEDFDRAIYIDAKMSEAYNNRAYAKLMSGELDTGLADIQFSLSLNDKSALAYRNLGIYYLKNEELDLALDKLHQAASIDETLPELKELITACELKMLR